MDKIAIERETVELAASLIQPLTGKGDREVYDALRAALAAQPAEPVAWRWKERVNGMSDSDWTVTNVEPPDGVRVIAKESLYAAQPADIANPISQQEPVAWRHSKTGQLYDSEEEVPLADGDEWAEPLYAAPVAQQEPSAWRQWSTKQHDWDYQTNRGDLRPDALAEPLFVAAAQPGAIEQALQKIADFGQEQEQKPVAWIGLPGKGTPLFTAPPAPAAVPLTDDQLRADLISCRGTVKADRNHYERLAEVHRGRITAAAYEAEASRLDALLERIDALIAVDKTKEQTP